MMPKRTILAPPPRDVGGSSTASSWAEVTAAAQDPASSSYDEESAYVAYLKSPAWLNNPARLAELEAAYHRCRLCNRAPPMVHIEVHHRTYRNLFCERAEDLTTLCQTCHAVVTEMLRERQGLRRFY